MMARGSFRGIRVREDVTEPQIMSEGMYNTVRCGWLFYYYLAVPPGWKVEETPGIPITITCTSPDGRVKKFKYWPGSPWDPAVLREVKDE